MGESGCVTPRDTWRGEDYAQHSSLQAAMADEVLSRLELRGDEQLLDLGCGEGKLTARIAERVPRGRVLGVDASADMVAFAQRQFGAPANLSFEVCDARELRWQQAFDLIVSFNALHWVPQQELALQGIRRALKPGARAWLRLVTRSALTSLEEVAEALRAEPPWAAHFAGFTDPYLRLDSDEYAALARRVGFAGVSVSSAQKRWDFGTEQAFFGFCHAGFGAWTAGLPQALRSDFTTAVMRRYLEQVDTRFGETCTFHFTQTDVLLQA